MPRARPAHGAAASLSRSLPQGDAAGAAAQGERPLPRPPRPRHGKRGRGLRGPGGPGMPGGCGDPSGRSASGPRGTAGPRLTAPRRLCPQSQPDGEPLPGALEKEDARSAPSTPSTPSVCSPPSSSSSTPSAGKNVCSSCGLEILDRYLLKVSGGGGGRRRGAAGGPGSQPPSPPQVNNLIWHVRCLECSVCRTSLRQQHSCYIKNKEIFCKMDYFR